MLAYSHDAQFWRRLPSLSGRSQSGFPHRQPPHFTHSLPRRAGRLLDLGPIRWPSENGVSGRRIKLRHHPAERRRRSPRRERTRAGLALLPNDEKAWLLPHKAMYLLGTEAPDNRTIPVSCNGPNRGYDDRSQGHSVKRNAGFTQMTNDRAARRAQEEYNKAVIAFRQLSFHSPEQVRRLAKDRQAGKPFPTRGCLVFGGRSRSIQVGTKTSSQIRFLAARSVDR